MSVSFYFDHNMPLVIASALRDRGIDVLTTREDGYEFRADEELLQRATDLGRAVVSQDQDFLGITHDWQADRQPFAGLVFAHAMHTSIGSLISDLELVGQTLMPDEIANTVVWIPF